MFTPGRAGEAPKLLIGAALPDVFPPDVLEDWELYCVAPIAWA